MIYTCDKCRFIFERTGQVDSCPDCGKPSIREATPNEREEFRKKKAAPENTNSVFLLEQHEKGLLDDTSFLKVFGKAKIFYSTPYGDHKDGGARLFALPASESTGYLPVFSSHERIKEFYENAGRCAYMIIEGTFLSFLETTRQINTAAPVKMGAVIDPGYFGVTVNADMLDTAISLMK
ncbi:MAG: SseB family protein [Gracilibacteraceae bacterium]|nr:SseB family protein [Gracilibacteraceae bacterium]